ncbi:hypothetical protein [Pseudomonas sp. MS19]|uniref:hypothetical protein n=1 Tax=Pseudomonas sp. MS19 TaxID=2579939 RepID=UPI001561C590|nr:hypothetical protein [Pseudomonas sp. MS19]NRH26722.1 hypothetical protein [Pseudomonas sp. MS19]
MTEAALRIPSSTFNPEPKPVIQKPKNRKTGGWIACAAPQSVMAMQSPNQQTNAKSRTAKTQSQSAQHSPAAMTQIAMRIPSSTSKPEPKSGQPKKPKTGGWIACAAPQSVKAMQSPNQQTNAKSRTAQMPKSNLRNTVPPS